MALPGRKPSKTAAAKRSDSGRARIAYNDELAAEMLFRISVGETINKVCQDKRMPSRETFYKWMLKHDDFREAVQLAKTEGLEAWADDIVDIADDLSGDVQRDRLRIDSRKWIMAKMLPKKYGEKVQQEVSGPDGGAIENKWTVEIVDAKSADS